MLEMLDDIITAISQDYPNPREVIWDVIGTGLSDDMEMEFKFIGLPRKEKDVLINTALKQYGF